MEITFVRHAETVGNAARVWQGQGDSALTELGRRQGCDLGRRVGSMVFDVVVSSDLGRVLETASLAGIEPEVDPTWREVDIGDWEGLNRDEVFERFPTEIKALRSGIDIAMGGAESWRSFGARVDAAIADLESRLGDSDRALVLTHGGLVNSIVAGHLGFRNRPRPWPVSRLRNTSLTTLRIEDGERTLTVLNDATHTVVEPHPDEAGAITALVRHGEAAANVEGRWHGLTDDPLTDRGRAQAAALAAHYDGLTHVYSSALERAYQTAAPLAQRSGLPHIVRDDLHEMKFGAWEDMTPAEIAERFPDDWQRIMVEGNDLPRGGDGETMEGAGRRIAAAVEQITAAHPDGKVAVVSHGGAIRGYLCGLLGVSFRERRLLALPANTSVSHIRSGPGGPVMVDYNLVPGRQQ